MVLQTIVSWSQQDDRKKRTAKRLCDKRDRAITWEVCRGVQLILMFCGRLGKYQFKGRCSLAKRFFKLSRLSHKVCRLLSSPVLLRKFTNIWKRDSQNIKKLKALPAPQLPQTRPKTEMETFKLQRMSQKQWRRYL